MSEWLPSVWMSFAAIGLLWFPGLLAGYAGGLRGVVAWGSAPLLSASIVGTAAVGAGLLGVSWSLAPVVVVAAVLALVLAGLRRVAGRWRSPHVARTRRSWRRVTVAAAAAVAVAGLVEARRLTSAIGAPDRPSQTYDAAFHLNSVRLILESGDASSLTMTLATPGARWNFYPAAWHGFVSLLAGVDPAHDVVAAANWFTVVIASLVWPASMLVLARCLFGPRPWWLASTGVLAFVFPQFPNQLTAFGVLYPNLLSYAILPALLAVSWLVLWRARGRRRMAPLAVGAVGAVGVLLAQPNGLFALGFVAIAVLAHYALHLSWRAWRRRHGTVRVVLPWALVLVGSSAAYWAAGELSIVQRFRSQVTWEAFQTTDEAIEGALLLSAMHPRGLDNVLVATAVALGVAGALVVARWRWLPFAHVTMIALFAIATSASQPVREAFTGYWYGDGYRLAALLPLLGIPLAVVGLMAVVRGLSLAAASVMTAGVARRGSALPAITAVSLLLVLLVFPRTEVMKASFVDVADAYAVKAPHVSDGLLDVDEAALLEQLPKVVPPGSVVAGDPWKGSSMTWAVADRKSLFPHARMRTDDDKELVAEHLGDAATMPEVCDALDRLDVEYVVTSRSELVGKPPESFRGFETRSVHRVAEPVVREGSAVLWRITACAGSEG